MDRKKKILIVDDEKTNLKLLSAILAPEGYEIYLAENGFEALEIVKKENPDLILLDIMMPEMDGFEVCRRIKADKTTKTIPVVMVTALTDKKDKVKAADAGADEFISKPVDRTELQIRVRSLLRIRQYQEELMESYRELERQNERLRNLEHMKEELTHMVIHDIKNSLFEMSFILQLFLKHKDRFSEKQVNFLKAGIDNCEHTKSMIQNVLDIYRMQEGKLRLNKEATYLDDIIDQTTEMFRLSLELNELNLNVFIDDELPPVEIDRVVISRVLSNLLYNALKHTPRGGDIVIRAFDNEDSFIRVEVENEGDSIPREFREKIFDRFEQLEMREKGIITGSCGLGLSFCKMAVECHGGRIWVDDREDSMGSRFCFVLPKGGN
ncbi:MAG: response regulator [Nitrospirae bacterium]|nr:MAG: response regulator [Nitrospirota bacterium]